MTLCDEAADGPAVLQLQTWNHLEYQFQLSDFSEAFISPSMEFLLLLSNKFEALLLPLVSGKESAKLIHKDDSNQSSLANIRPLNCLPFASPKSRRVSLSDSFEDTVTVLPTEVVSHSDFLQNASSSVFEYYPVISNVKSLTWGHTGDSYGCSGDYWFGDFLIVSGNNDIIIHAFRNYDENTNILELSPEDGNVHGMWVNWSSKNNSQLKEQFSHNTGHLYDIDTKTENSGKCYIHKQMDGADLPCDKQKNGLWSFLSELQTSVSDGKYLGLFPAKSSIPHSANVVSFSIHDNTLAFLSGPKKQDSNIGATLEMVESSEPISELSSNIHLKNELGGISYECSRVFSSSSHRLIGLVLNFYADNSIRSQGNSSESSSNIMVVVIMLHYWGIQWLCSVDLQDTFHCSGSIPSWVDFQFSCNFLFCLNTSGFVSVWGTDNGSLVTQFDTVQCCELNLGLPLSSAASMKNANLDVIDYGAEHSINSRTFRKLVVVPHSLHLAIIDERGVVFLLDADDYIPENYLKSNNLIIHYEHSDHGILAGWKVASCCIGGQQIIGLSSDQELVNANVSNPGFAVIDHINRSKRIKLSKRFLRKESQTGTAPSGFGSALINDSRIANFESRESAPIRQIFIPLDRSTSDECICLSPFGITRVVKCCNTKEQQGYKIIHTDLHLNWSVVDERDLYTSRQFRKCFSAPNDSFYVGESLGCLFQGFLYLVTQSGLSVVLPSVSISSGLLPLSARPSRHWSPNGFAYSKFDTKNMLEVSKPKELLMPWQTEVLDRVLLFEGPKEAKRICLDNGIYSSKLHTSSIYTALYEQYVLVQPYR